MKWLYFLIVCAVSLLTLVSCGSLSPDRISREAEAHTKVVESRANVAISYNEIYVQSLQATAEQIKAGEKKTDGQGLYCVIANESRYIINTYVIGPIPKDVVRIGPVSKNIALALLQSEQYFYRPYYLKSSEDGVPNYKEDYLPIGKYIAISFFEDNNTSNGWCFEVTGQLKWYKDIKVHGYAVYNGRRF